MARDFTGAGGTDRLDVGDVTAIDITGTAITICAWIQPDRNNTQQGIVAKWDGSASTTQYALQMLSTGKLEGIIHDGTASDSSGSGATTVSTSVWHHTAMRKNGTGASALQVFLDGTSDASATSNRSMQNSTGVLEVGNIALALPMDGRIAEVCIWDVALTDNEIAALAKGVSPLVVHPLNLKGYWPLWGLAYPEADLSGNQNGLAQTGTINAANHAPIGEYASADLSFVTNVVVPVTSTLSCAATNTPILTTLQINARIFAVTAIGVLSLKRDAIRKLTVTVVSIPKKLFVITRIMTTLVGTAVPRVLRQPGRILTLTGLAAPVVRLIRFGASAWDEIDAHRKWGITNAAKWSIKQVQRFQYSSAMKGR